MKTSEHTAGRPLLACGLSMGLVVLFNCFGFPVYNFNKGWTLSVTLCYLFLTPASAVYVGGILAKCFPEKGWGFAVSLTAALVLAGLGCRFLLEFGEVSNVYNFTLPNVLLHIFVFTAFCSQTWRQAAGGRGETP